MNLRIRRALGFVAVLLMILFGAAAAEAQTTSFTYQGKLTDGGAAASGNYDFQFALWDSLSGGTQVGATQTINNVTVSNGVFTVTLDFGAASFPGADRFLEISARPAGSGSFTLLSPRQQVTSTPYAVRSANASSANTLSTSCNGCISDTQIGSVAASKLTGALPVGAVPAGSGSYIQNTTTRQANANFNISGSGAANVFDAATQFNLGGQRVLSQQAAPGNLFVGLGAGSSNTTGFENSFFGTRAGLSNNVGGANSFFGANAGSGNTNGLANSFFGADAGQNNAGGSANSFFGAFAGVANRTGSNNSFFGWSAGSHNSAGTGNSFFGDNAGSNSSTGSSDSFFGAAAGVSNLVGTSVTVVGANADVSAGNLDHATAIGAGAVVGSSNTVVLGRGADTVQIPGAVKISGAVNISGTVKLFSLGSATSPQASLCRNTNSEIAFCSSSLRYKTDVTPFLGGLGIVNRLRPITYTWKLGGGRDIGFGAEEVERVEPLFTFRNDRGEIEGVRYDRLSVVFVNAFKEQQKEIEGQQLRLRQQQEQIKRQQVRDQQQQAQIAALNARLRAIERALRTRTRKWHQ
ncbi:MAG: tail fiber domain-containing protein [Acidobacteria bacterium]|nr:tail fiber domain-containing protein [Acidobacteriota bacterium]